MSKRYAEPCRLLNSLHSRMSYSSLHDLIWKRKNEFQLLGISVGSRAATTLIQIMFGIHSVSWLPGAVAWSDFFSLNGSQMSDLAKGLIPYRSIDYTYMPLFLYSLYPFYRIGGMEGAVIPILIADAATSPLVYLLAKSWTSDRIAFVAGMAYALSQFILFSEGYLFLSSQPMVFFLFLSLYFLTKGKPLLSSFSLGLSVLFKQEALFILPMYAYWYLRNYKREAWKGSIIFLGMIFFSSLPFFVLAGPKYLGYVSYGLLIPLLFGSSTLQQSNSQIIGTGVLRCSSIPNNLPTTGIYTICGVIYSWSSPVVIGPLAKLAELIPWVATVTSIPVFLMTGVMLYRFRKSKSIFTLSCAYSMIGFLILFALTVHLLFSYYFLPVYALIFASTTNRSSAITALIFSGLTILIPDGTAVPALVSMIAMLCMLAVQKNPEVSFQLEERSPIPAT